MYCTLAYSEMRMGFANCKAKLHLYKPLYGSHDETAAVKPLKLSEQS